MKTVGNEFRVADPVSPGVGDLRELQDHLQALSMIEEFSAEFDNALGISHPNPFLNMAVMLLRNHVEGRTSTATALISTSGLPYATARRKLEEMQQAGLIEKRARTRTGKSFSLHPSPVLLERWRQLADRMNRIASEHRAEAVADDYYFGGSYMVGQTIAPPTVLSEPLTLSGGLRILVHGDPTFMVMENLKRQFEQIVGTKISQRAFSIDRLRHEALRNAERPASAYDIIAVDLPWIGEFVEKGVIAPLDDLMDVDRLDPDDFHIAGWRGAHWGGRPYGVPSQTTPELLFFRRDLFAEAGIEPPVTTSAVLDAARHFHEPTHGRYGIAWNAARGTALGHTFMMTCAAFGQPMLDLPPIAGGFDTEALSRGEAVPTIDTPLALDAAEYLLELLNYAPPDILSMSWYERVRPFASGAVPMAYGYTLLAPYFELDESSPARGHTGYLPHPAGPSGHPIAPVGGYVLAIPANLAPKRQAQAVEALIAFTSPGAQKLYVLNGSRTAPRYSVGADADVRRLSPIFEAVDQMSWRDELQFWPRPPIPGISEIIAILGHDMHDMLRGIVSPKEALRSAQAKVEKALQN
ncbi:extracellular solute-binding protein [Rhodobacterales bacterium HKCCE3408]|nr:extracellular solute-binding protein [Rhodobacterales bacterium HKCCE3408]